MVPHCEAFSTPHSYPYKGPNIRLRILFLYNIIMIFSLKIRDHVSQPFSTIGKITVLYVLIFLEKEEGAEKNVWTEQ